MILISNFDFITSIKRFLLFATCLVQGNPSIEYVCTTLIRKLLRGTRLMAVPNGKNQIYLG
jgi:hypothetical protein